MCWVSTHCKNNLAFQKKQPNEQEMLNKTFKTKNLIIVYQDIKSSLDCLIFTTYNKVINKINMNWFIKISFNLKQNTFRCPTKRKLFLPKKQNLNKLCVSLFTPSRIKILKKSLLTAIKPFWTGNFKSKIISHKKFKELKINKKKKRLYL